MAAVTKTLFKGKNTLVVQATGVFDSADEANTIIVDKSALVGPSGLEPGSLRVDEITWSIGPGFDYVMLEWDHNTDDLIAYLQGGGYIDYRPYGGNNDPESTGGTGDIVLTTVGGATADTYTITLTLTLKT